MTTALPGDPVIEPAGSLEIRWIFPGELDTAVTRWFTRFPAETREYRDTYLLEPHLPALSVKIRARRALEVKAYRGSPAILDMAGRARGPMQSWQKWSFPLGPHSPDPGTPDGWIGVHKTRRVSQFSLASGQAVTGATSQAGQSACSVELAEARALGKAWWTIGFEATGPPETRRTHLEAAAALVFAQPLPGGAELGPASSSSYAQWLIWQASPGTNARARRPLGHRDLLRRRAPGRQGYEPLHAGPVIIDWHYRQDEPALPQPDLPDQNRILGTGQHDHITRSDITSRDHGLHR